ncbi:MAG: DUF98 domain-containing protein [Aphanocapsa feldmannii 277cV]|uniref:DUF98 domain-containing protein n=2 Tax=Aphanocapsa feldmannii TaxID=192050 RepID=A0A524RR32_9CHRO|nr:MAG: DUF98 domain-containing protein [Aphanocapsa feldmannii 277cV]TGH18653.1 MAG: DUF98 domain-containing protein [Aphanocapsa feldmannii 277cI]
MSCRSKTALPGLKVHWAEACDGVVCGHVPRRLSPAWRLLLLGDGSPSRHLGLLSGDTVRVELITMEREVETATDRPSEVAELEGPMLRRRVWVQGGGDVLLWAESWWNEVKAAHHLGNVRDPIWTSLSAKRTELFRQVDGLALVSAPWLEDRFGARGPYWSRHYRFFRGGRVLTVIREVFSPVLERWLGSSDAAVQLALPEKMKK